MSVLSVLVHLAILGLAPLAAWKLFTRGIHWRQFAHHVGIPVREDFPRRIGGRVYISCMRVA